MQGFLVALGNGQLNGGDIIARILYTFNATATTGAGTWTWSGTTTGGATVTNQVANAVSYVFMFALAAGLVVLYAAIASTQDERVFDAAIMRTLGASRRQMIVVQLAALSN